MNNLSKKVVNDEGQEQTIIATSDDNYKVNLDSKYTIANHTSKKESKLVKKFIDKFPKNYSFKQEKINFYRINNKKESY